MNQSVFLYNQANIERIKETCLPLEKYLGISHFGYLKVYNTSQYFYVSNDLELTKEYLLKVESSNIFQKEFLFYNKVQDRNMFFILWPDTPKNLSMGIYLNHDYWNGLTILKQNDNNVEMWWFATQKENTNIKTIYKKHLDVLIAFIDYFNYEMQEFRGYNNKELAIYNKGFNFKIPGNTQEINQEAINITAFINHIFPKGININSKNGLTRFSQMEINCLRLLARYNSVKEIAKKLGISHRTVERHIENMRNKSGYRFKSDLVNIFHDQVENLILKTHFDNKHNS